jgi:uncharacterized coiled-coil protein SlyX
VDTDERLTALERKLAEHDTLIARLVAFARLTPKGRMILRALGL